jgi:hypothetical protein
MAGPNDMFPVRSGTPGLQLHAVKFVGGTNAVTKVYGEGVTVTYVSAGIVDLTFPEQAGTLEGVGGFLFSATTTADVKSYVAQAGTYNTATRVLRINMHESGTLTNLAALEWLTVTVLFKANP